MEVFLNLALTWLCPLCQHRNFVYEPLTEEDHADLLEEFDYDIEAMPDGVTKEPESVTCASCHASFAVGQPDHPENDDEDEDPREPWQKK